MQPCRASLAARCPTKRAPSARNGSGRRHAPRRLRDRRAARGRRDGRSVSRARHQAGARRRAEGPAAGIHGGRRSRRALRTRSTTARIAQSSAHRGHLRFRRRRQRAGPGARAGRGRHAGRSRAPGPAASLGGAGRRATDRRRARRRPRGRDHPSRSQTLQHQDHARWRGQGARLRSRKSPRGRRVRSGSVEVPDHDGGRDDRWCDSRHRRVHEPGAGARSAGRQAHRHLGLRVRALRDVDGLFSVSHARPSRTPSPPSSAPNRSGRRCRPIRRPASDVC